MPESSGEAVEVYFDRRWQPGVLTFRKGDGWCRVVVAGREMSFAPHEVRDPSEG